MFLQVLQHTCLTSTSEITQRDPKTRKTGARDRNFIVQWRKERHAQEGILYSLG